MPQLRSIQGTGHKRGRKSSVAKLNDRTLATAYRRGMRLEKQDYQTVVLMRQNDRTIAETAILLERTYYGTQAIFASVGLLMRCFPEVIELITKDTRDLSRKVKKAGASPRPSR